MCFAFIEHLTDPSPGAFIGALSHNPGRQPSKLQQAAWSDHPKSRSLHEQAISVTVEINSKSSIWAQNVDVGLYRRCPIRECSWGPPAILCIPPGRPEPNASPDTPYKVVWDGSESRIDSKLSIWAHECRCWSLSPLSNSWVQLRASSHPLHPYWPSGAECKPWHTL